LNQNEEERIQILLVPEVSVIRRRKQLLNLLKGV